MHPTDLSFTRHKQIRKQEPHKYDKAAYDGSDSSKPIEVTEG